MLYKEEEVINTKGCNDLDVDYWCIHVENQEIWVENYGCITFSTIPVELLMVPTRGIFPGGYQGG